MDRKDFLKTCSYTCLGSLALGSMLSGCFTVHAIPAQIQGVNLVVPLLHFEQHSRKGITYISYVVVSNEQLKYPICVFRQSDCLYTALLMQCTHQGTELQAFGDRLQCPAHGSEFNREGKVMQGPADTALRQFPVTLENQNLLINLQ